MKLKSDKHELSCASGERGIWLNLQTACLLILCIGAVLAAAAIIAVTVLCDSSLHVSFVNGTLACGKYGDLVNAKAEKTNKLTGDGDMHTEGYNHTLGSTMRIVLVLIVVTIIIIVSLISMHKVVLREKHKKLSGQLNELLAKNGNDMKGGSQILTMLSEGEVV